MCGIAGAAWTDPHAALDPVTLERMTSALSHRGPDDWGTYCSNEQGINTTGDPAFDGSSQRSGAALGHRRLSIIDLGGGHQPLTNEDGSVWIVFNGEIYNYRELREELIQRGHQFRTSTDTEVIVHLYEEMGPDCVQRLRGMFVFAIWDDRRQRLMVARDRIGQKPLFYRLESNRFLFASELKSLLQVRDLPRVPDPHAIEAYLTYQYVPHPQCILQGFAKLPPAHLAVYENNALNVSRYWSPPYQPDEQSALMSELTVQEWQTKLRETLTEAVRLRMRSDVPLGAFLSGGIDSTIIAGLMQSLSSQPIHTFSIGFPIAEYDERSFAREAAEKLGTDHHERVVDPSALATLPKLIWHYDEPFSDSSAVPSMALCKWTREFVTVALSGDGGDELFAGYDRYQAVKLAGQTDRLPTPVRNFFAWNGWQRIPTSSRQKALGRRIKRFAQTMSQTPERRYLRWVGIFDNEMRNLLYTPQFREKLIGYDSSTFIEDAYQACPDRDFITRTTCVDLLTYLPCDILTKVDLASMAFGLEARSPFLDHHVVELAARMPIELKLQPVRGKKILIETFEDLLPKSIQKRPKMGFGVPIDHWFRNELADTLRETLLSERCLDRGYFRREPIQRLIDDHQSRRWDHAYRLWNLLCLECWHRIYIDSDVPVAAPEEEMLIA